MLKPLTKCTKNMEEKQSPFYLIMQGNVDVILIVGFMQKLKV